MIRTLLLTGTFLGAAMVARADFEADLLDKYQKEDRSAAEKMKREVEGCLTQAAGLRGDPERADKLLRKTLETLDKDKFLPAADRAALGKKLEEKLIEVKGAIALRKREEDKRRFDHAGAEWARHESYGGPSGFARHNPSMSPVDSPETMDRKPIFFTPVVAPFPSVSDVQVTPVVLPDRRWIRIGVSASFIFPKISYVPVPVFTQTVLQGPGRKVTPIPFFGLTYVMAAAPAGFTAASVNTTVMAPDGGSAMVGGYSSSFESSAEYGVPGLSGIPYANRLFSNRSYGAARNSFGINVSPRVIILAEE